MAKRERPVHRKAALNRFTLAVGGQDPSHDAIVTPFSFARKISDTAACGRRQGSALRSDRSRGKALTAVLAGQIINYPGEGKKEKVVWRRPTKITRNGATQIPPTTPGLEIASAIPTSADQLRRVNDLDFRIPARFASEK